MYYDEYTEEYDRRITHEETRTERASESERDG